MSYSETGELLAARQRKQTQSNPLVGPHFRCSVKLPALGAHVADCRCRGLAGGPVMLSRFRKLSRRFRSVTIRQSDRFERLENRSLFAAHIAGDPTVYATIQ